MNVIRTLKSYAYMVRINKPFLAIPFAVTAAFLSCSGMPNYRQFIGLMIAVFFGFFAGNAFNAVTDRELDRMNPRSADRPVAAGDISVKKAYIVMAVSILFVIVGTAMIALKYLLLLPIPLIFCLGYSLSKRYTWLCHVILGITNAICPVASWGIFGGWNNIYLLMMGAIVFFWTIGFEVLYSSQDAEYDREYGTKSIPVVFGCAFACRLSAFCHIIMFVLWTAFCMFFQPGFLFCIGLFITAPIIVCEHMLVENNVVKKPALAFDLNQIYSISIMLFAILNNIMQGG